MVADGREVIGVPGVEVEFNLFYCMGVRAVGDGREVAGVPSVGALFSTFSYFSLVKLSVVSFCLGLQQKSDAGG